MRFDHGDTLGKNQVYDLARNFGRILLNSQLRKNVFQRGQRHQRPQTLDGIVGDNLAAMQNDNARADAFNRLEFVGAQQHHLAASGHFLQQISEDERGAHVETGKRLVQKDEVGVVQQCSRQGSTFWRMPLE